MINLYEHQETLIEKARASFSQGNSSVLMVSPTGSGKSIMASEIIRSAIQRGKSIHYVVPRKVLLHQMADTFNKFNFKYSYIASGFHQFKDKDIYLCSLMTVKKRLNHIPQLAIIDETHFGGAALDNLIEQYKANGVKLLGMSATPIRQDGKGLDRYYDDVVIGASVGDLMAGGFLSGYRMFAPDSLDFKGVSKSNGEYNNKQLEAFMMKNKYVIGSAADHYLRFANGTLGVTFCPSINYSKMTAETFREKGIRAEHVDGEMDKTHLFNIIKAYARKEIDVLSSVQLLTFGFDLASASGIDVTVESMFDLDKTNSLAKQMQKWGRCFRKKDHPALIFDHVGNVITHGMPDSEREWDITTKQKGTREASEATITVKQCKECHFCHRPAPVCPNCGYVYTIQDRSIEEIEGELKEIERVERAKKTKERKSAYNYEELVKIGIQRGYNNPSYWAKKIIEGRKRRG